MKELTALDSVAAEKAQALLEVLEQVVRGANLRVALIGGMAVNFWEEPRYTAAVDLVVAADAPAIKRLTDALLSRGFTFVIQQAADSPSGPDFVRMAHSGRGDMVDLQTSKTEYQDLLLSRAVLSDDQAIPVASPEDLLILKLIANRPKDHRDLYLLVIRDGIDWAYVERWANTWGVAAQLEELRQSAARAENPPY